MPEWFNFSLVIDAALLVIFFVTLFITFKKGFLKSVLGLLAWYISFALALALSSPVSSFVYDRFIKDDIVTEITERLPDMRGVEDSAVFIDAALEELPDSILGIARAIGIDIEELVSDISLNDISFELIASELEERVVAPIATAVCRVVAFGILFLVLLVVLRTATFFLNTLVKLPLLRPLNRVLGFLLGLVKGAAALAFLSLAFNIFAGIFSGSAWSAAVSGSRVVGFFNEVYAVLRLYA